MTDNKKIFFFFSQVQGKETESEILITEKRPIKITKSTSNIEEFFTPLNAFCVLYPLCMSNGYFTTSSDFSIG